MKKRLNGIILNPREKVTIASDSSKAGLIMIWLSIPGVYIIPFIFTYIPSLIRAVFSKAFRDAISEAVGVSTFKEVNFFNYITNKVFENIPKPLLIALSIPFVILTVSWFGLCIVMTRRYSQYSIVITDIRVIGKTEKEMFDLNLTDIVNVFLEQSLSGKLLNYGNITITSKRKSFTFRNIKNPKVFYNLLISHAENNSAY